MVIIQIFLLAVLHYFLQVICKKNIYFNIYGETSVDFRKHNMKDTGGSSRKNYKDTSKGTYEEVDESRRGERGSAKTVAFGVPFSLTTPLGIKRKDRLV